ncbi:hypothetical protein [Streptomyces sp. NPDC051016]|uniref:hypothetical protein n=1 Tax=Streptomyces sp. NPDC051016 TaxID=3365638 RepID=UPI0037A01F16
MQATQPQPPTPSPITRILTTIATQLRADDPTDPMTSRERIQLIDTAIGDHPDRNQLLTRAYASTPRVSRWQTRGQYAQLLTQAAG